MTKKTKPKPKFKVGDKVVIRAGQLVIIDAEVKKVDLSKPPFIDYELETDDIIFGVKTPCFEEHFLFTKEEADRNFLSWMRSR